MSTKNTTQNRNLIKPLLFIPLAACLLFTISIRNAQAQNVQSKTLTELVESVYQKMESAHSLSVDEQATLIRLVANIKTVLVEKYDVQIETLSPREVEGKKLNGKEVEGVQLHGQIIKNSPLPADEIKGIPLASHKIDHH